MGRRADVRACPPRHPLDAIPARTRARRPAGTPGVAAGMRRTRACAHGPDATPGIGARRLRPAAPHGAVDPGHQRTGPPDGRLPTTRVRGPAPAHRDPGRPLPTVRWTPASAHGNPGRPAPTARRAGPPHCTV